MYTYLQNAISMFNNPLSVSLRLSNYKEPIGTNINRVFEKIIIKKMKKKGIFDRNKYYE